MASSSALGSHLRSCAELVLFSQHICSRMRHGRGVFALHFLMVSWLFVLCLFGQGEGRAPWAYSPLLAGGLGLLHATIPIWPRFFFLLLPPLDLTCAEEDSGVGYFDWFLTAKRGAFFSYADACATGEEPRLIRCAVEAQAWLRAPGLCWGVAASIAWQPDLGAAQMHADLVWNQVRC